MGVCLFILFACHSLLSISSLTKSIALPQPLSKVPHITCPTVAHFLPHRASLPRTLLLQVFFFPLLEFNPSIDHQLLWAWVRLRRPECVGCATCSAMSDLTLGNVRQINQIWSLRWRSVFTCARLLSRPERHRQFRSNGIKSCVMMVVDLDHSNV